MFKRFKMLSYLAVLVGGTLLQFGGCNLGGQTRWLLAILQEDIFG